MQRAPGTVGAVGVPDGYCPCTDIRRGLQAGLPIREGAMTRDIQKSRRVRCTLAGELLEFQSLILVRAV
jgi:hypothetical protein